MANCPKCNHHLRLADWKQKCPYCGANIVLYDLQERLMADADIAEVQNYHFKRSSTGSRRPLPAPSSR